jgi:DNA polymerase-3 subunit epsilon
MIENLRKWNEKVLMIEKEGLPLTLEEVIGHHEAGIWSYSSQKTKNKSYLRLLFPAAKTVEPAMIRNITILTEESRPVFYDFDLFSQLPQIPELEDRLVTELEYTVFDTETTGLDPRGGDEIISIGAVRIINGQLLHEEFFDQLIDPQRPVPRESRIIHGIEPEMLKGQPTIEKVLPLFHSFCENTVLVAHNAAFDMLMLKMKEEATGVKFINPVLDTLLLSDVLHPAHKKHDIETIAKRLGIRVVGRHTALGDAITAGEMFLKMIPLLGKMGIYTLKEARLASQKTYHARLKY